MKIAIVSMQRIVNFGSVLQAYSLRRILRELTDAEVEFLDIEQEPALKSRKSVPDSVDYETPVVYPPGIFQRGKRWCIARLSAWNKRLIRGFMEKELGLTEENSRKTYDLAIVGSDEVFNHKKGVCLQLHGEVRQAPRVITYAASCGSAVAEDIEPEDMERVKSAMGRFAAMSVRDEATERYAAAFHQGALHHHLDPVLVGDLYCREHRKVPLKNYLLVYAYGQRIRTPEEINAIRNYARKRKLKIVAMGGSQFWCDLYIPAAPLRLMDYFYGADCVLTDTFHGTIFSVINGKRFAVMERKTNRNKLTGLLKDLELEDRLVRDLEDLEKILSRDVAYDRVETILQRERLRTRAYLRKQLEVYNGPD